MIKIIDAKDYRAVDYVPTKNGEIESAVSGIIESVRARGDEALKEYAKKFDGADLTSLKVTDAEFDRAMAEVDGEFLEIIKASAENIRKFHTEQLRADFAVNFDNGSVVGQRIIPIEKVGLYVPGGTASYPSTVLMDAIPAKIAGVSEIVMVTPPKKDGSIPYSILAAAKVAGVDKVFKVGGAGAIAALAYGTESIPKVYKIVGPGNAFVAEAKRQVFGAVSIDMIAGPSEILVIADKSANAKYVAADLLSQAEHDKNARAILVTDDSTLIEAVKEELEIQIPKLERREIAKASIDVNGLIIKVKNLDEAIELSNEIAPEHLELYVENAMQSLPRIKNAGSVFVGGYCPEAVGDYFAGANHTLPTSGTAKFSSPLSVDDFIKKSQYIYYPETALKSSYKAVDRFAREEGLTAHAKSVTVRFEE